MEKEKEALDENVKEAEETKESAKDFEEVSENAGEDKEKSDAQGFAEEVQDGVEAENVAADDADDATANDIDAAGAGEANTENDDTNADAEKKKKKIFNKKKDKKDQQIEELNDKYQRLFAEFQNFRSRSEKEKSAMFEVGAKSIIEKILPVVDNFERGIASLSEEDLDSPVGQGMNLIYKQMTTALEEMGVTVIETEGKEFDPELHNAVMHEDNEELGENVISQEFQKGYKYRDTVIRHSMVKVAN